MRNYVLPLALIASLGLSSMALASTNNTTDGTIKSVDVKTCTVTLDPSTVYHFAKKCDFKDLTVGEKVTVTWHLYKKIDVGTKIAAYVAPTTTTTTPKTTS